MQRVGFEPAICILTDCRPRQHSHGGFTSSNAIFNEIIQHLLHSKVAKAESYLIGGYHNEWLELTYYIETLNNLIDILQSRPIQFVKGLNPQVIVCVLYVYYLPYPRL